MIRLYIPENLDIDQLMHDEPPNFKKYKCKRDKLLYIIHLLNAIPLYNKDLLFENFVPLNSTILQDKISNYKEYLDYLLNRLEIIETDGYYIKGLKSKGYRLIDKYKTPAVAISIIDRNFYLKLKIERNNKATSVNHLGYLTKWFNEKLEIDIDYVNEFLEQEFELKQNNPSLRDYDRKHKKFKFPMSQFNHAKISAEKIKYKDFYLQQDKNVYRFHSNLTNMRSVIRNSLTYDGQELISVDIKNSQPYLSTILFDSLFWNKKKEAQTSNLFIKLNINNIKLQDMDSYIMLGDYGVSPMNKEFKGFIDLVKNGTLYEFLENVFKRELGETFSSRREVKQAVFQVLYTDNRFLGQEDAKPKKLFKEIFPDVYEVFRQIKQKDKTLLPRLLQSIESYLMIDVISKRISEKYPKAPIFTIHDSISTTAEYVDLVEQVMEEELSKAIGHSPKLEREMWSKSNMMEELEILKEKSKIVA